MWALVALMTALTAGMGACSAPVARRPGGPYAGSLGAESEALFHHPRITEALAEHDESWETWRNDPHLARVDEPDPYDALAWPSNPRPSLWGVRYLYLPSSPNTQIWFEQRSEYRGYEHAYPSPSWGRSYRSTPCYRGW